MYVNFLYTIGIDLTEKNTRSIIFEKRPQNKYIAKKKSLKT